MFLTSSHNHLKTWPSDDINNIINIILLILFILIISLLIKMTLWK